MELFRSLVALEADVGGRSHEVLLDMLKTVHKAITLQPHRAIQFQVDKSVYIVISATERWLNKENLRVTWFRLVMSATFMKRQASQTMKQTVGAECPVFQDLRVVCFSIWFMIYVTMIHYVRIWCRLGGDPPVPVTVEMWQLTGIPH